MKKYTKQILAMLALNAIYSGSGILILSFINKYLLDGTERGGRIIALFFGLLAIFLLLSVLSRIMLCKMENDFVFDLRTKIIKQIIDTKFERIEAASKANLLASLSSDISRLTEGFMRISELIQGAMIVLFCGIYVLYIAPMMFAFLFVWIGALMIFNRFLMKKVMQNYDLYRQNEDVLYKNYAAAIEGHKELSLSLAKAKSLYENDFLPNAQNLRQSSLRAEVYGAFASNFMNVMMLGAVGFVLYFGLSGGKAELANAVTIALTVLFLRAPLMMLIFSLPSVLRAKIAYAKINELGLDPFVQGFELAQMQPWRSLELKDVGFSYPGGKFGIKGVNLQLNAGETVFLIGENGSVWYNAVIRADGNRCSIGKNVNIQDCVVIHGDEDVTIEDNVSLGHSCVIHGATIKKNALIGMGAVVMDNAIVGENSIVAAGTLIPHGKVIPLHRKRIRR